MIRLATVSQKMASPPEKAAITVPNENCYVVKRPRVDTRRKFSSGWTSKHSAMILVRNAIVYLYATMWVCTDMAMKVSIVLS